MENQCFWFCQKGRGEELFADRGCDMGDTVRIWLLHDSYQGKRSNRKSVLPVQLEAVGPEENKGK